MGRDDLEVDAWPPVADVATAHYLRLLLRLSCHAAALARWWWGVLSSRTLLRLVLPQLDLEDWSWWWCGGRGDIPQMLTAPETKHS